MASDTPTTNETVSTTSAAPTTTTSTVPTWKGKKGDVAISDMATAHIKNAVNVVEVEISKGVTTAAHLLEHLKKELSGRTDA